MTQETKLTSAEKKARYRKKMRAEGYKSIEVWVAPNEVETVRKFVDRLPKPSKPSVEGQQSLFGLMGNE